MKVSAPAAPVPDLPAPDAIDPSAPLGSEIPAAEPSAPVSAAMAKWPDWFKPVDLAMAILVSVMAFLLASYTARNTDIWRHLGTGRLIAQGHHPIGGDPLSYTGAERAWVNSNWMFDVSMYAIYSADDTGATAVVVKAMVFAAAFAVLFLLRKPDQALWPWAVAAALGVVATGSLASLRPFVFGMLLQSILLVLIYRGNWTRSKWRMPAISGGLCWIWACTDSFFLLGPLTVLLVWVGEKIHKSFTAGEAEVDPADDPFWAAPSEPALRRALLLCAAGALLNPMFLGALARSPAEAIGQLVPFELTFGWGDVFSGDKELTSITLTPLSEAYYESADRGDNVTGYTALALMVGSGALLGAGLTRLRATHVLLWFAFVALALLHYRFIPVAIVMAVPLAAGHLNGLSRFRLQSVIDPATKMMLTLSGVGRIVSVTLLVLLVALTIPGRLHARVSLRPEFNKRVSWGIDEDVGLARGAKLIEQWKSAGLMPTESRGLLIHYDFGDYCAWHAPREKVFVNSRFRFHGAELKDLVAIRSELQSKPTLEGDSPVDTGGNLKRIADKYGADFIVLGISYTRLLDNQIMKVEVGFAGPGPALAWLHMDGRIAIASRTDTETGKINSLNLVFTPAQEAFAPDAPPVPSGKSISPLQPVESWLADYFVIPQPSSVATDDAVLFVGLARLFSDQMQNQWMAQAEYARLLSSVVGVTLSQKVDPGNRLPNELELAFPIMANRAARRAIVETPDDPEPYLALAHTYTLRYTGALNPRDNALPRMTSLRRFLDRVPVSPNGAQRFSRESLDSELTLFLLHYDAGQMDLALEALSRANARIKTAPDWDIPHPFRLQAITDYYRQKNLEQQFGLPQGSLEGVLQLGDGVVASAVMSFLGQRMLAEGQRKPSDDEGMRMYRTITTELANTSFDAGEKADKPKPRDAAWVKARTQMLEDRVKREIGKRNESYTQNTKAFGLVQKFLAAAQSGFPGRAIDMVFSESDWDNVPASGLDIRLPMQIVPSLEQRFGSLFSTASIQDMKDGSVTYHTTGIGLNLQAIALQLQSGSLDKAAQQLTNVSKVLDKAEQDNTADPRIAPSRAAIKQLRSMQARLEGNFDQMAEDSREQLQLQPKLSPAVLKQFTIPLAEIRFPLAAAVGTTMQLVDPVGQLRISLAREALLYYDLGMTALQAGDNKQARERFAMALKPQGVALGYLNISADEALAMFATRYSAMLDKYASKPAK